MLAGPHPRSLSRGDFAPRSGRRRCCLCSACRSSANVPAMYRLLREPAGEEGGGSRPRSDDGQTRVRVACAASLRTLAAASESAVSRMRRAAASFLRVAVSASRSAVSTASCAASRASRALARSLAARSASRAARAASNSSRRACLFRRAFRAERGGDGLLGLGHRLLACGVLAARRKPLRLWAPPRAAPVRRVEPGSRPPRGQSRQQLESGWLQQLA